MGFLAGVACVFRGLGRLVVTPALWGWSLAPVVFTFAFLALTARAGHLWLDARLRAWVEEVFGGSAAAEVTLAVVYWAAFAVALFFVFAFFVRLVAAPLLALLADRTVAGLIGRPAPAAPGPPVVRWVMRPLWEALLVFLLRSAITLLALPLLLVPVAGGAIFSVVVMGTLGLDLLDIAQSARGVLLRARLAFVGRHLGACLGLGIGAGLLLLVPCVNVLLLPAVVVAAVLLDARIAPDFPRAAAEAATA